MVLLQLLLCLLDGTHGQIDAQSNLDMSPNQQLQIFQCRERWQWMCKNSECIAQYDVCDGIPQCSDGSDEWSCDDVGRQRKIADQEKANKAAATTTTTTTTVASTENVVVISRKQFIFMVVVATALIACIFFYLRRKARIRVLNRNRRGKITQSMFTQDSDEDDILISSMYS